MRQAVYLTDYFGISFLASICRGYKVNAEQLSFDAEGFEIPDLAARPEVLFKSLRAPLWTEHKAKLVSRYLYYFVLITHHGTYIDGFAGPQSNDNEDTWAAKLVLQSRPRWLRQFFLCDADPSQCSALEELKAEQLPRERKEPKRDIRIRCGDFNTEVHDLLSSGFVKDSEAAFCLLDQRTFECVWSTVRSLANHKRGNRKIELLYFLAQGWLGRALAAQKDREVLDRWWGDDSWRQLRDLQVTDRAQLLCKRLQEHFGYKYVHPWPIFEKESGGGRTMYHMIHATDHDDSPKLMARAYRTALEIPEPPEQFELLAKEADIQLK
jgi:three-Cys-motif partner protein